MRRRKKVLIVNYSLRRKLWERQSRGPVCESVRYNLRNPQFHRKGFLQADHYTGLETFLLIGTKVRKKKSLCVRRNIAGLFQHLARSIIFVAIVGSPSLINRANIVRMCSRVLGFHTTLFRARRIKCKCFLHIFKPVYYFEFWSCWKFESFAIFSRGDWSRFTDVSKVPYFDILVNLCHSTRRSTSKR